MESTCTAVYMSPNKCTYARGKVLVVEVQIATSSRFPTTVDCFLLNSLKVLNTDVTDTQPNNHGVHTIANEKTNK